MDFEGFGRSRVYGLGIEASEVEAVPCTSTDTACTSFKC